MPGNLVALVSEIEQSTSERKAEDEFVRVTWSKVAELTTRFNLLPTVSGQRRPYATLLVNDQPNAAYVDRGCALARLCRA